MTKLQKVFKDELGTRIANNCAYALEFVDGKIAFTKGMCWATVYRDYCQIDLDAQERDVIDVHSTGYINSHAPVDRMLVDIRPASNGRVAEEDMPSFIRALQALIAVYEPAFEGGTFEERWSGGLSIPIHTSTLTPEEMGGFLITLRNLHEQGFWRFLVKCLDAGFTEAQSVALCQLFYVVDEGKGHSYFTRGYHTMFNRSSVMAMTTKSFISLVTGKSPWFSPEFNNTKTIDGAIGWEIEEPFQKHFGNDRGESIQQYLSPIGVEVVQDYDRVTVFPTDRLIATLKDLLV